MSEIKETLEEINKFLGKKELTPIDHAKSIIHKIDWLEKEIASLSSSSLLAQYFSPVFWSIHQEANSIINKLEGK